MPDKKRYIKVKSICQESFYIEDFDSNLTLSELLDGSFSGDDDGYIVSVVEMTENEYKVLPEFDGF